MTGGARRTGVRAFPEPDDPAGDHARHWVSRNGRLRIHADARLDARDDLIDTLMSGGRDAPRDLSDADLILDAYDRWGTDCVDRLLGDFAFAIWDGTHRRLFCARDRFGVKPFYYALANDELIFSTVLDELRTHPHVSDRLNDDAIGDFLLFGANTDWSTTTFADIQRLPPAHTLIWDGAAPRIRRYWSVPTTGSVRYRRPREYVERFAELLFSAVTDRLTAGGGVWLSGGLDSSALLAVARTVTTDGGATSPPRALTVVYDKLIADRTRQHATQAAHAVGLTPTFVTADEHRPFEGWGEPALRTSEPTDDPFWGMRLQHLRAAAAQAPVWLYGEGADELLWPSSVTDLAGQMPWLALARDLIRCAGMSCRPPIGARRQLRAWRGLADPAPPLPEWLNPTFSESRGLRERWHAVHAAPARKHPTHHEAAHRLATAPWPWYFETFDPGTTGVAAEGRYPFLDLRLVDYVLSIPALPWCVDKHLLREAMRGRLPEAVRNQRKRPLGGDPLAAHFGRGEHVNAFPPGPEPLHDTQLREYVDLRAVNRPAPRRADDHWLHARPLCLHYWLAYYWRRDRGTRVAPVTHSQ